MTSVQASNCIFMAFFALFFIVFDEITLDPMGMGEKAHNSCNCHQLPDHFDLSLVVFRAL